MNSCPSTPRKSSVKSTKTSLFSIERKSRCQTLPFLFQDVISPKGSREEIKESSEFLDPKTTCLKFSSTALNFSKFKKQGGTLPLICPFENKNRQSTASGSPKQQTKSALKENNIKSQRQSGKSIDLLMLNAILRKEQKVSKIEAHQKTFHPGSPPNFKSEFYVQHYISKFKKNSNFEKIKSSSPGNFTEKNFGKMINSFYQKKISKSNILLKYFEGKNTESVINTIGKYLYNNLFEPVENNLASLDYLELIHKPLQITSQDFDLYKGFYMITMRENGFSELEIQAFISRLESYRGYIVKKRRFDEICSQKNLSFEKYIRNVHENIQENGILRTCFQELPEEFLLMHHKELFNLVEKGYDHYSLHFLKAEVTKAVHAKFEFGQRECFELKNIFFNQLLDKNLDFSPDAQSFHENLRSLHKFVLPEPHLCDIWGVDVNELGTLFHKNMIQSHEMMEIFAKWQPARMESHCKYMIDYLTHSKKNVYQLNDLAPTHCGVFISGREFDSVQRVLLSTLTQSNISNEDISKIKLAFGRTRNRISREQPLLERIGGKNIVDSYIDTVYTYMFGLPETQPFYLNAEAEYVKYKQKVFFCRAFNNEIDGVDLMDLKMIHEKMGIKKKHFDIFVKFSREILMDLGVEENNLELLIDRIRVLEHSIVQNCENKKNNNKSD